MPPALVLGTLSAKAKMPITAELPIVIVIVIVARWQRQVGARSLHTRASASLKELSAAQTTRKVSLGCDFRMHIQILETWQ
jgi:hypothetical protein